MWKNVTGFFFFSSRRRHTRFDCDWSSDVCSSDLGQKISREPRALLAQVPGLTVVPLAEADWCCGSAGTYNLTQPEMAQRLQARKVANVRATGVQAVVTANPGCIILIAQGLA